MVLSLLGLALVLAHFLWKALAYFRWSQVPTEEEAGAFAERVLLRQMTGFRVERGWRNGVRHAERKVFLTGPVLRGRSVYHLAVAAHEVGHALQWGNAQEQVRNAQGLLTAGLGVLVLGVLLSPSAFGAGLVLLGYALFAATYPLERDANQKALEVVGAAHRAGVRRVLMALSSSYLLVPLGGALMVVGWLWGR